MFNNSTFCEILKLFPKNRIKQLVKIHKSDRYTKNFKTWDHLISMIYAQLSAATSLRDIVHGFNSQSNHHYHLNTERIKRSTLSDANNNRSCEIFKDIAVMMIEQLRGQKKEMLDLVRLIDSTPIQLRGRGYEWTKSNDRIKGLKLHIEYASRIKNIEYIEITDSNINDLTIAKKIKIESGKTYVMDKGYCDYNWWQAIIDQEANFVTRLKYNAQYKQVEENQICKEDRGVILKDELIKLSNRKPRGGKFNNLAGKILRLITIKHPSQNKEFKIVTSLLNKRAIDIASLYKERWDIELLFKWLKQNLKLKNFFGTSKNAVSIQIYVAIICYVLTSLFKQYSAGIIKRLKDASVIIKTALFNRPRLEVRMQKRRSEESLNLKQLILEL